MNPNDQMESKYHSDLKSIIIHLKNINYTPVPFLLEFLIPYFLLWNFILIFMLQNLLFNLRNFSVIYLYT